MKSMDNTEASLKRCGKMTRKIASHDQGLTCETRNLTTTCADSQLCSTAEVQLPDFLWNNSYKYPTMIKRFVNEELPKRPNRKNMSIVVARLMGVEDDICEKLGMMVTNASTEPYIDLNAFYPIEEASDRPPTRREHPHEDELKKLKKDFVAFQEKFIAGSLESSPANNIVILKSGVPKPANEQQSNITELLEKVKERLKSEISGSDGTDHRKLLACQIAERVRERVVRRLAPPSHSFNEFPGRVFSFRCDVDELYSGSLARSLSSPTSTTQLLLEDRNMLTGTRVRSKQKVVRVAAKQSFLKKLAFLKAKFFGSKMEENVEKPSEFLPSMNTAEPGIKENPTEVPSTPVAFWDVRHSFAVSPPDVSTAEDLALGKIAANLNDLRRQLSQLDGRDTEPEALEAEVPAIDDKAELYVRDLLVESGLYYGPVGIFRSNHHDFSKPVSLLVFEKLEALDKESLGKSDRRMLFDLLNEVLLSMNEDNTEALVLTGRKLLDCVWKVMCVYLHPVDNNERGLISLEEMVARNIGSTSWLGCGFDRVWLVKEIELLITGDIVREILVDFFC